MESGMSHLRAMFASDAPYPELSLDWIEQKIIRAYVQLAAGPDDLEAARTVTVVRLGSLDVSLTEDAQAATAGLPPFLLELRSRTNGAEIDSFGWHDFDEDELAAAVAFVWEAAHRMHTLH
jgi:hypothetical protein